MEIQFTTPLVTASASARTISGRIVTFGEVGSTSAGPVRFRPGSIAWKAMPTLNLEHNKAQPIGRAVQLAETPEGIDAVFHIAATNAGNDALVEASDGLRTGFSVGVDVEDHTYDGPVMVVNASQLNHVAHVVAPAIRSAVVTGVAASEPTPDPDTTTVEPDEPQEENTVDSTTPAVAEAPAPVEASAAPIPVNASVPLAVASPARVQDAFPYGPQASNLSFFRDIHNSKNDVEASARAHKANQILIDAALTSIVPPGYRPDLYVDELLQLTPVASLCAQFQITDATAFTVPTFTSGTGLVGDAASGTNPATGSVATGSVTVSPKAVSGLVDIGRDVVDATNPGVDQIIMTALMEDYSQDLEAYVVTTVLAGARAGTNGATLVYTKSLTTNMAAFPFTRFLPVTGVAVGPTLFSELALEEDTAGRPKNPYLNPTNSAGQLGQAAAALQVNGVVVTGAWSLGVQQGLLLRKSDAGVWTSGPREFREEGGTLAPGIIRFALWGYTGAAVLRQAGVVKYTQTP